MGTKVGQPVSHLVPQRGAARLPIPFLPSLNTSANRGRQTCCEMGTNSRQAASMRRLRILHTRVSYASRVKRKHPLQLPRTPLHQPALLVGEAGKAAKKLDDAPLQTPPVPALCQQHIALPRLAHLAPGPDRPGEDRARAEISCPDLLCLDCRCHHLPPTLEIAVCNCGAVVGVTTLALLARACHQPKPGPEAEEAHAAQLAVCVCAVKLGLQGGRLLRTLQLGLLCLL